jgi:hypothetical protein
MQENKQDLMKLIELYKEDLKLEKIEINKLINLRVDF